MGSTLKPDLKSPDIGRLLTAFQGQTPDRVPNFEVLIDNPTLGGVVGRPMAHTLSNLPPEDYIDVVTAIGQDAIGLCFYDDPLRYRGDDGRPRPLDFRIACQADIERILPTNMEHLEGVFELLGKYCKAVEGTGIGVFALTASFFTLAYDRYFGFENFMMATIEGRESVDAVLEMLSRHYEAVVKRLVNYPISFLYIGDDVAYKSGLFVHPSLFKELWTPRMARVMRPAVEKRIPILFHSDGNTMDILPDLLDMGVSAINPIEPYGMDIREVRRRFGQSLCLVGNLDVGGCLSRGTPDDTRREARELIETVGSKGGLVLASSHSITRNVLPQNFLAMVDEAHCSVYPLR